jgi:hypothetical protein
MIWQERNQNPKFPPRLSMEEYARAVEQLIRQADPEKIARQHALDKKVRVPFSLKK